MNAAAIDPTETTEPAPRSARPGMHKRGREMSEVKRYYAEAVNEHALGAFVSSKDYDALAAQRDEAVAAHEALGKVYNFTQLGFGKMMAQRDEGLAREAELRERLAAETGYYRSTLRNVLKDIRDDIARGGLAPSWSGVAETISIALNTAGTDSPGCADGEKAP
jgi:hypothetical protein